MFSKQEEADFGEADLVFEETLQTNETIKRVGKMKHTGTVVLECILDQRRREKQKSFFDEHGKLSQRIVYEYDSERRPKLTVVYDGKGHVLMKQERGNRPVFSSESGLT